MFLIEPHSHVGGTAASGYPSRSRCDAPERLLVVVSIVVTRYSSENLLLAPSVEIPLSGSLLEIIVGVRWGYFLDRRGHARVIRLMFDQLEVTFFVSYGVTR